MHGVYPITIIADRYCGAYSKGYYTAWNLYPNAIPAEQDGDDVECMIFWSDNEIIVGKGNTADEAEKDLISKLAKGVN